MASALLVSASQTWDAGGDCRGWDCAAHQELWVFECLMTEGEEKETKCKVIAGNLYA